MNWKAALVLLFAIAGAENTPEIPVGDAWLRTLAVVLATIVVAGLSHLAGWRLVSDLRRGRDQTDSMLTRIRLLEWFRWCLWGVAVGFMVFVVQWPRVVRFDWQLDRLLIVDHLLILAPIVLSLVGAWAAACEVRNDLSSHAMGKTSRAKFKTRMSYAFGRLRDELSLVLLPVGILLVAADVGTFASRWAENEKARGLAYIIGLAILILALPSMLRRLWRMHELRDGVLKTRLTDWAAELSIQLRAVYVWETGGRMVNAAVVGILPRWRYVLLTDQLICRLNSREVEAVALHEMAHIARRHTLWRALALFPPIGAYLLAQEIVPTATALTGQPIVVGNIEFAGSVILALCFAAYAVVALSVISRLLEHDADLLAFRALRRCEPTGGGIAASADLASALKKLAAGNRDSAKRKSWLHPSVNRRLAFLRLVSVRPERGERFCCRVRATGLLLALCPLLTAAILVGCKLK